jgi:hypothetical protein
MKGLHVTAAKNPTKAASEIEEFFRQQEQRTARGWRPEPGTTMRGTVIGLEMRTTDFGDCPVVVYTVAGMFKKDGTPVPHEPTVALYAFHQVLRERLVELKTDIGSDQYVSYLGEIEKNEIDPKTEEKKKYHMYDADNAENVGKAVSGRQEGFTFGS